MIASPYLRKALVEGVEANKIKDENEKRDNNKANQELIQFLKTKNYKYS